MIKKTGRPIVAGILLIITTLFFLIIIAWQAFDLLITGINLWDGLFVFLKAWFIVFGLFGAANSLKRNNFRQSIVGASFLFIGIFLTTIVYTNIPSVLSITYISSFPLIMVIISIILMAMSRKEFSNPATWSDKLQEQR